VNQRAELKAHAKEDLAGDGVERVTEETDVQRSPSSAERAVRSGLLSEFERVEEGKDGDGC
jgi:hypothetical protein